MRIAGVSLPVDKKLSFAMRYVHGVGPKRAEALCLAAKIDPEIRVKDLSSDQEEALRAALIGAGYLVESDLRREVSLNIKRLQDIGSYRGFRHRRRLPVRGQNTKTNARTRKGKKGMAVTKKKIASK
jgi:small subunit ribosomal protein S13